MFSSLGLFKNIPCPKETECTLPNCLFQHTDVGRESSTNGNTVSVEYDPSTAGTIPSPPRKKRRLDSPEFSSSATAIVGHENRPRHDSGSASLPKHSELSGSKPSPKPQQKTTSMSQSAPTAVRETPSRAPQQTPKTIHKTVSPPPTRNTLQVQTTASRPTAKKESLTPRNVAGAPATISTRLSVLKALHQQLLAQNEKLAKEDAKWKPFLLDEQELIVFALDEEERHAREFGADIYRNAISQRILRIKKLSADEWRQEIGAKVTGRDLTNSTTAKSKEAVPETPTTGLSTQQDNIAVLKQLQTPLARLEKFGYVLSKPSEKEVAAAKDAALTSGGFEVCDRCGTRFQVFPGRDEEGCLTSKGKCRYHWARLSKGQWSKSGRVTGDTAATFPCCNRVQGSEGCTEAETHVFKVTDPKRLASVLQFETTPVNPKNRNREPLSFDCEMAYTTSGLELMRLTAVSWPDGKICLDVLVRPYGEVLDFNTRFSGITSELYANAPPFSSNVLNAADKHILTKVESVALARSLLFDILDPEIPLIGHAIENDLNVCRIIHPFVIDTVLLYPHPRGLPIRYGLKMLSQKYLSKSIQAMGEQGHDSKEDAVTTGELVTLKVAEKWRTMKAAGWTLSEGTLVAPEKAPTSKALL